MDNSVLNILTLETNTNIFLIFTTTKLLANVRDFDIYHTIVNYKRL